MTRKTILLHNRLVSGEEYFFENLGEKYEKSEYMYIYICSGIVDFVGMRDR